MDTGYTAAMLLLILLLAPPAPLHKRPTATLKNGKTVDCKWLGADPGEALARARSLGEDPALAFEAFELCFAEDQSDCAKAWVTRAIFGGLSMAVVDGVAPPIEQRQAAFMKTCQARPKPEQRCQVLSYQLSHPKACDAAPNPQPVK